MSAEWNKAKPLTRAGRAHLAWAMLADWDSAKWCYPDLEDAEPDSFDPRTFDPIYSDQR